MFLSLFLVAIGVLVSIIIYLSMKTKWIVEIRHVCGNRRIVEIHKGMEVTKDGVTFIKIIKTKTELPYPPEDAIDITPKGKKFVVAYNLGGDNYQFCKDTFKRGEHKDKVIYAKDTATVDKSFQPITTNQRLVLIEQIKKAHARRKNSLWDVALPIAGLGSCVMVLVALFVFWGDLAKPVLEAGEQNAAIAEKHVEITHLLQEIIQKKQVISDSEEIAKPPESGGSG